MIEITYDNLLQNEYAINWCKFDPMKYDNILEMRDVKIKQETSPKLPKLQDPWRTDVSLRWLISTTNQKAQKYFSTSPFYIKNAYKWITRIIHSSVNKEKKNIKMAFSEISYMLVSLLLFVLACAFRYG